MQKNGTVSQNLTMMKPAIATRAIQKGSFRAIYMHKDFLLTISNMLILPPALKI